MKKLVLQILIVAGFVVAASASGSAQTSQSYRAHIPFDFTVGKTTMKAGDYRLAPAAGATNDRNLVLQSLDSGKSKFLGIAQLSSGSREESTGRLLFAKNGGEWALANIETPTFVIDVPRKANVKVITQSTKQSETATVALH
jgi:hypothetical protein